MLSNVSFLLVSHTSTKNAGIKLNAAKRCLNVNCSVAPLFSPLILRSLAGLLILLLLIRQFNG
jgi:hypothetical protein